MDTPPTEQDSGVCAVVPDRLSRRAALTRLGAHGGAAAMLGAIGVGVAQTSAHGIDEQHDDASASTDQEIRVPAASRDALPAPESGSAGRLRYLEDDDRSLWLENDQGWFSLQGEVFNVRAFGATGDGKTDDWAAFHAAIDAMTSALNEDSTSPYGRTLLVPPGSYRLAQSLVLDRAIHLAGVSTGGPYGDSVLVVDRGIHGVIVGAAEPGTTGQPGRRGDGSIIEHLRIELTSSAGAKGATSSESGTQEGPHGVWLQAPATVRDCSIGGFAGNGLHVESGGGGEGATGWVVTESRVERCGGHGLAVRGDNADGGTCVALLTVGNGGWGIADEGTRGNTYLQCRADGNGAGAFTTNGPANRGVFVGCDSASGQAQSQFAATTIVVGGNHQAGYEGGNAWTASASRMTLIAQAPGGGETALPTVPTLVLQGSDGQADAHVQVLGGDGEQQVTIDAAGRLLVGPIPPGEDTGGTAEGRGLPVQIGHPVSGQAGLRWIATGDFTGWVAQARAYRDAVGPDAQADFTQGRLTFQTPDANGAEIDTMTLRQGSVGIGTVQPAALLDLTSTTSGFLPPRMTSDQRDAMTAPPEGLVIYNLSTHRLDLYVGDSWREIALTAVGG
ncbi:MAG TPA: glycosyl hydrolase family 28-related protein [Thermomicrobiales bacterium]